MKEMRKVLSFVLILALVMGSFSMVFAADSKTALSDIAGLLGEAQIEVCQNLGIIQGMPDGTFQPDTLVNRAQFAAIITRALGIPDSALAGYATTSFKDTAGYGWAIPYLAFCQSKGIMIGDGQGNAMPGRSITVNEAITMILRAIGYIDSSSELVGKWPANYVTLGKALKLYDDLSDDVYMDRENAAIAIYNALIVQLVSVNTDGKTDLRWITVPKGEDEGDPATLLNTGLDCYSEKTVLTPSYFSNSMINISERIGAYGRAYFTDSDDILVAFSISSTFITGTTSSGKFKADGKTYSFDRNIDYWGNEFMNAGDSDDSWSWDDSKPAGSIDAFIDVNEPDGDEVTLAVKLSGLTIKEIHSIAGWQATEANLIKKADISAIEADQELFGGEFALDDDREIDLKQFSLVGVKALDDIDEDNVVYAYFDEDDIIRKVAVGQEEVEGVIKEVNSDEFVIDGKTYEYAIDFLAYAKSKASVAPINDANSEAIVKLDAYGFAFDIDTTGGVGMFGVVYDVDPAGFDNARIKMVNQDDADNVWNLVKNSKLEINNADKTGIITVDTTLSGIFVGNPDYNALVGYKLNSDGQIKQLDTAYTSNKLYVNSKTLISIIGGDSYTIDKDAVVFSYNPAGDLKKDDISVATLNDIDFADMREQYASTGFPGQFVLNKSGKVVALLLLDTVVNAKSDDVYGVINSVTGTTDASGDNVQRIRGLVDGSSVTLDTTTDARTISLINNTPTLYMLTKNGSGKVKAWETGATSAAAVGLLTDIDGVIAADRAPGDGANNIIELQSGRIAVESDAVVYRAVWSSSKSLYEYTRSTGITAIRSKSLVWAYDTKDDKDKTDIATVVIWADQDDLRTADKPKTPLTISAPTVTESKTYDGTATAAVTAGTLSGVKGGDTVTVSAVATYDNATVGTSKTITVVYTLGGADAGKYTKPVNTTLSNGVITKANPTVVGTADPITGAAPEAPITEATLAGVTVTGVGGVTLPGQWSGTAPATGVTDTVTFTFTPTDAVNYEIAQTDVDVTSL